MNTQVQSAVGNDLCGVLPTQARSASEGLGSKYVRLSLVALAVLLGNRCIASDHPSVLIVVGAEGAKEYGEQFREWAGRWEKASAAAGAEFAAVGLADSGYKPDRELLQEHLAKLAPASTEALWLILIGHGTYDGKTARFGLRGPDFTPTDLATWLKPIERPLAIIDCTSSSGPFLNELSAPNRAILTAARSGSEFNYARFGDYISSAITDSHADLDKDDQTSLLEAFLLASSGVREFYAGEGRLATEHALIDDNGDKLGTPADWFAGLRATKTAKDGATLDGLRASQFVLVKSAREAQLPAALRSRRDELELDLAVLREQKSKLPEDDYFSRLEPILLQLSKLYESADTAK
jgi:hypothetical protein